MGLTDWMGTFGRAQSLDLSNDLERGYEAALLIQSIELEHYNDRPVRPELELRLPRGLQAQILRRFRAALQVCRQTLENVEPYRQELAGQEIRQIQLVEAVASRYSDRRQTLPSISRSPEVLPRSLLGVVDQVRRQLDPEAEASVVAGFCTTRVASAASAPDDDASSGRHATGTPGDVDSASIVAKKPPRVSAVPRPPDGREACAGNGARLDDARGETSGGTGADMLGGSDRKRRRHSTFFPVVVTNSMARQLVVDGVRAGVASDTPRA